MTPSTPAKPGAPRRVGLALAALAAGWSLLACSSGEPTNPAADPSSDTNTYVLATITLLDRNDPCPSGVNCDPEFFDCVDQTAYTWGETWTVRGDIVTAGLADASLSTVDVTIAASDVTEQTGVALEFQVSRTDPGSGGAFRGLPGPSDDCEREVTADINGTFADLNALCARVNANTVQESRFQLYACEPSTVTITSWETDGSGLLQLAEPVGGNEFSPSGILEGTFSFVGRNRQSTPAGDIQGQVLVEGCFRVNVPIFERQVPSNPTPSGALCSP